MFCSVLLCSGCRRAPPHSAPPGAGPGERTAVRPAVALYRARAGTRMLEWVASSRKGGQIILRQITHCYLATKFVGACYLRPWHTYACRAPLHAAVYGCLKGGAVLAACGAGEPRMTSSVATACCIAGAWRDWALSWRYIEPNVVEALNADVYAVSDSVVKTPGTHGRADPSFTVERMRAVFGRRFRAGEQLSVEQMANVSGLAWDEIVGAQAELGEQSKAFPYIFKIWRCGQLIARSRLRYDAIVRLRPDLTPQVPLQLSRWPGVDEQLELRVGPVCTRFGTRDVVVHAFTGLAQLDKAVHRNRVRLIFRA